MTPYIKARLGTVLTIIFILALLAPFETTMIPRWKLQVVDVSGTPCSNMRVTQSWGHYRLFSGGNYATEDRVTDINGYVEFPQRMVQASLSRRIVMPVFTRVATLMHGGWVIDGAVWASGIKDVAWLTYQPGKALPDKMRVEKCISDEHFRTPPASSVGNAIN